MKCPECVRLELTSRLNMYRVPPSAPVASKKTPAVEIFFDESGKKHIHAPAVRHTVWACSNNHAYDTKTIEACPVRDCMWNDQPLVKANDLPLGAPQPEG